MELLEQFTHGDLEAFEILFRQFQKEVYGWIVRIVRDPRTAEDLTVETFWRIYRSRARFDPRRSFGAWARRIATNVSYNYLKSPESNDSAKRRIAKNKWENVSVIGSPAEHAEPTGSFDGLLMFAAPDVYDSEAALAKYFSTSKRKLPSRRIRCKIFPQSFGNVPKPCFTNDDETFSFLDSQTKLRTAGSSQNILRA